MNTIRIYEVTPRDGLQNEKQIIDTADKIDIIQKLIDAGYKDIEVTSFVKPSWIPQLADSAQLMRLLPPPPESVRYWALVPNLKGLERAIDTGIRNIATFMSVSATHNRKNLNRTKKESLSNLTSVIQHAKSDGMNVRAYLSTVFGCPYEGDISKEDSLALAQSMLELGVDEIALGDTTGMGNPKQVQTLLKFFIEEGIDISRIALHLHDTRGTALANAYAGYLCGVRTFDGSTAGLGGCPYAPGASGNAASEDLVQLFSSMEEETGIDLSKASAIGQYLETLLKRPLPGRYYKYHKGRVNSKKTIA